MLDDCIVKPSLSMPRDTVVVLGCGVSGLSTAITLLQYVPKVIIVAEHLPTDAPRAAYTSWWAGANWWSFAEHDDKKQQQLESYTYKRFADMVEHEPEAGVMSLELESWYGRHPYGGTSPWFQYLVDGYRELKKEEMHDGCEYGFVHRSFSLSPPDYLQYLLKKFKRLGGHVIHERISHIHQVFTDQDVISVVNCTGLQSMHLGGVHDLSMFPIRGQTVLVHAPEAKKTITKLAGSVCYIIPRPDGTVILGGTRNVHSWVDMPDPVEEVRIIKECVEMCPELIKPGKKQVDIVSRGVGFRPGRQGGIRLEAAVEQVNGRSVIVAHNYGHASYGFQTSWGCAERIANDIKALLPSVEAAGVHAKL